MSFVVPRDGVAPSADDLIAHCRAHLADFKVPAEVHFLDEIPKGPSGKLLRRELRDRYAELVEAPDRAPYATPVRRAGRPRPPLSAMRWPALDPEIHGDLNDFARAIDALSAGDLERLVAFWETVPADAREDAHVHAQDAAQRTGRRDVIHALQEDIIAWGSPSQAARAGNIEAGCPPTRPSTGVARRCPRSSIRRSR